MSHLSATKLTFSPKWATMDDDERAAVAQLMGAYGAVPPRDAFPRAVAV